tara:strand:+ start:66 stop:239 length:174 start_codon:yes stop_codon:yes gene_type:complete
MKIIRQTNYKFFSTGLVSDEWFDVSEAEVLSEIKKENFKKLKKDKFFKSNFGTFKII